VHHGSPSSPRTHPAHPHWQVSQSLRESAIFPFVFGSRQAVAGNCRQHLSRPTLLPMSPRQPTPPESTVNQDGDWKRRSQLAGHFTSPPSSFGSRYNKTPVPLADTPLLPSSSWSSSWGHRRTTTVAQAKFWVYWPCVLGQRMAV
jgi:hypothetical protein